MKFSLISPAAAISSELTKSANWQRVKSGTWTRPKPEKRAKTKAGSLASLRLNTRTNRPQRAAWASRDMATVLKGLYRIEVKARSQAGEQVSPSWFQAGWLSLYLQDAYLESLVIPLGTSLFSIPGETELRLKLKPVAWLPNVSFVLEKFTGELPGVIDLDYESVDDYLDQQQDYGNVTDAGYV